MENPAQTIKATDTNKSNLLLLAEHDNQILKSSTAHTLTAARQLSKNITIIVAGHRCESIAKAAACLVGVTQVLHIDAEHYAHGLAENMALLMQEICQRREGYGYILAPATTYGKNILPRLAALLDVSQISEITQIISSDSFVRPIYAGNAFLNLQSFDPIKLITVRSTAFEQSPEQTTAAAIVKIEASADLKLSTFIKQEATVSSRPELTSADIVIAGGRGMQSKENFKQLEEIADQLGAGIGASRAAVDAGFVPNDYQVGQTGKVVAPKLYIAVGISGAIQHLAGMKDSKVIVAINKDPEAAIFQVSDYYLVGDLFEILPQLKQALAIHQAKSKIE